MRGKEKKRGEKEKSKEEQTREEITVNVKLSTLKRIIHASKKIIHFSFIHLSKHTVLLKLYLYFVFTKTVSLLCFF